MIPARTEREARRLRRIAERFQREGFEVTSEPRGPSLPSWLRRFNPDLVATRGREGVVVEVRSRGEVRGDKSLQQLAEIVEEHPGWRFELDMSNPRETSQPEESAQAPASEPQIREYLQAADQLADKELWNPAILIAWAGFEGAARKAMAPHGFDPAPMPTVALLKALRTFGYVDAPSHERLRALSDVRNQVAHGAQASWRADPADVTFLIEVASQLLRID